MSLSASAQWKLLVASNAWASARVPRGPTRKPPPGWVATVDDAIVRRAATLDWIDFEDAVCAVAAQLANCAALVTRDPDGYRASPVPILDPRSALALVRTSAETDG